MEENEGLNDFPFENGLNVHSSLSITKIYILRQTSLIYE
jgi:hypothetical protein